MPRTTIDEARQVRLVTNLEQSKAFYRDILGCEVDGWGHALRGGLQLILQQAQDPSQVRPNPTAAKRDTYPTDWRGPDHGWDTFALINFEEFETFVQELHDHGAEIALGPIEQTHNDGMTFKNVYVRDPDGYTIVFGCGAVLGSPETEKA